MSFSEFIEWNKSFEKTIVDFGKEGWVRATKKPTKCGVYQTMRLGSCGIYCCLDEWKELDGFCDWQLKSFDGGVIIAYCPEEVYLPKLD